MTSAATAKERRKRRERKKKSTVQTEHGFPKYILTQRTLCACYMRCFREYHVKVARSQISQWQAGLRLGPGNKPWHPLPDDEQRYVWSECKTWFESVILPKYKARSNAAVGQAQTDDGQIPIEDLEDLEKRKAFEHREWERAKERGEFISRASALATGISAVKKLHLLVRAEDERHLPAQRRDKLAEILKSENIAIDLAAKICEEFAGWDIELGKAVTDHREALMIEATQFKPEQPS